MPSKSQIVTIAWTLVVFAALMRVDAAKDFITND